MKKQYSFDVLSQDVDFDIDNDVGKHLSDEVTSKYQYPPVGTVVPSTKKIVEYCKVVYCSRSHNNGNLLFGHGEDKTYYSRKNEHTFYCKGTKPCLSFCRIIKDKNKTYFVSEMQPCECPLYDFQEQWNTSIRSGRKLFTLEFPDVETVLGSLIRHASIQYNVDIIRITKSKGKHRNNGSKKGKSTSNSSWFFLAKCGKIFFYRVTCPEANKWYISLHYEVQRGVITRSVSGMKRPIEQDDEASLFTSTTPTLTNVTNEASKELVEDACYFCHDKGIYQWVCNNCRGKDKVTCLKCVESLTIIRPRSESSVDFIRDLWQPTVRGVCCPFCNDKEKPITQYKNLLTNEIHWAMIPAGFFGNRAIRDTQTQLEMLPIYKAAIEPFVMVFAELANLYKILESEKDKLGPEGGTIVTENIAEYTRQMALVETALNDYTTLAYDGVPWLHCRKEESRFLTMDFIPGEVKERLKEPVVDGWKYLCPDEPHKANEILSLRIDHHEKLNELK